jgi:LmbE family N-acetylglucosaminyl deacetylase
MILKKMTLCLRLIACCLLSTAYCLLPTHLTAQVAPKKPTSADIYDAIKKLNVVGSVLYVAAHPDDENTRLIAYLANEKKMNTTYLSITRGDGGQNLIGNELREMLGVLRTQELLMARSIDGGKQMFTRANDFGFSKSPAETMNLWNKKEVLADVVWAIRKTQPDVIINRFSQDTTVDTHGHHTGSALLSQEAFDLAGDPKAYSEQLKYVKTWQPKRLYFNTSWFFYGSREKFEAADKSKMAKFDVGVFYPTKGKSNNEIAAESRSMHRCQGFGSLTSRGSDPEYIEYLKGIGKPNDQHNPFEGINTSWGRLKGGEAIGKMLTLIERNFKFDNPAASVKDLVTTMKLIEKIDDEHWKKIKLAEIQQIIAWCCGLYMEASAASASAVSGQDVNVNFELVNRSNAKVRVKKAGVYQVLPDLSGSFLKDTMLNTDLTNNNKKNFNLKIKLPMTIGNTAPYWLKDQASLGMYRVDDQQLRGRPETPRVLRAAHELEVEGATFEIANDVVYKTDNPAKGEIYRPFEVTPPVFVNMAEKVYVFAENEPKDVHFVVKSGTDKVYGILRPDVPNGWKVEPKEMDYDLKLKGEEKVLTFKLTPPDKESEGVIQAKTFIRPNYAVMDNLAADMVAIETKSVKIIEYDHIPTQTVLQPAEAKIVKVNIVRRGNDIGYFMGAGDDMPACLEQIGYNVAQLNDNNFTSTEGLKRFDAIVLGIRAYNTKEKLKFYNQKLMNYVKEGGTVVVQYNTSGRDLALQSFGPYPFKIGRGRTTEEDAEIRMLKPEHPILNMPNKITKRDFDGWVQERGLYFLSEWDSQYEAILSCNDTNEKKEDGGLIVAKYGKGYYIYTGYSFFRQLPAGVSGAYRLFANLLSVGKGLP